MNMNPNTSHSSSKLPIKCWKSLYMKLTSLKVRYQDQDIEKELLDCSEHFKLGINQFSSSISSNRIELRENKHSTFMESFYQRLTKILHLDLDSCKEIFANYLLYNCNNAGTLLQERLEKNIRSVLLATWTFFAQERIFFLKCYYHIISSSMDNDAPYLNVFKQFLSKTSIRDRYTSLLSQYMSLIHKQLPSVSAYGTLAEMLVPLWINYNLREQLELLHILILITSQIEITLNDVDQLVDLVQITSFGRYQCFFYHHSNLSENQLLLQQQIHYAITFYAIQILSCGWKKDIYEHETAKFAIHNKILYPVTYEARQGPIVIAWILVLYHRLMNIGSYDEQLSNQCFTLLDDDLWKLLDDALHSNIMDMPGICKVMEPVIDTMVFEMFTNFGISAFRSPLTLASIITFFCKLHTDPLNSSSSAVLQYFRERFPLNCACLFKILGAVLNWTTNVAQRQEVFDLCYFLYAVKKDECKLRSNELNKYVLEYDLIPLKYVPEIRIPRGTEVVPDFEDNVIIIKKSLPIWDVMRNYMTMFLNGDNNEELLITTMEVVKFVEVSLQKVKTTIDDDILRFSELVVHVIWKTSSSCNSVEELKLLASCIQLHSVLFCIMPEDIIKCFEIYNFLPGYPVRMKRKDIQIHEMYYTQSRIYTIVCCKEAKLGEYPVLFSYLNFFLNVVQNTLETWYTVAGLKFVFHVYSNVNNDFWKFKNMDDRNLIIWKCIEVIHEILNHGLKDLYDKKDTNSLVDFKENESEYVLPTTYFIARSCVLSILNSVNASTVLSTAITGDIVLLETIMESACWVKGKSAIFINTITYALSLVQRCLIFINIEKKLKKTDISFDHLFQPEKCLALLSYRYNCFSDNISLLAIKLLIKLASIKENCMFSWLQYSNELLQKEFLYPLYSNNESNAVKSSLLALMAVCIMKQIVIADALLEIDKVRKICVDKSKPDSNWQNLLVFVSQYIHNVEKKNDTYLSNMHCAVLNVIYACWEKKLKVPQQYFKISNQFWKSLFLPFTDESCDSFNGYSFILETVCLEIVGSKTLDPNLKPVLESFLNSERFLKWTQHFADIVNNTSKLSIEFQAIPVAVSTLADSWKKFIKVVTSHCCDLIKKPSQTAFPIFEILVQELSNAELKNKERFLCDIYRIYLATWEEKCSETNWREELFLTSQLFIFLNEYHQEHAAPYFSSALLEIGYKIYKFGKHHVQALDELKNKLNFILACSGILNQKVKDFSRLILEKRYISVEYPPLLLHLCVFIDVIESLNVSNEFMIFALRETDFMNFILKTNNNVLTLSCGTKTAKMLLQFQNFMFEKYPFLKANLHCDDFILVVFQTVFPGEFTAEKPTVDLFKDAEKNNLFRFGLNFISNLTEKTTSGTKTLLLDFNSRNRQYLHTILEMITVSLRREDLYLIIAAVTFYRRIAQHIYYCKFEDVNELVEPMFLLFSCMKEAIAMLIQPSKLCALLFNVPSHHLQQFFDTVDNRSDIMSTISFTYDNLLYLVKISIQTLSVFCVDAETIFNGCWPPEDWNFRWLNKIKNKNNCIYPLLLLDHENLQEDFTILATFLTLQQRVITKRMNLEQPPSIENLVRNKLTLIKCDESSETLSELSIFLFSQSSMYLLHPQIDQSKKLFFVNQIFVNLKEFIRNAINDNVAEMLFVPFAVDEYEILKFIKNKEHILQGEQSAGSYSCVTTESVLPARQVLSLRGENTKPSSPAGENKYSTEDPKENEIRTAILYTVAALFYKLITTFKHS